MNSKRVEFQSKGPSRKYVCLYVSMYVTGDQKKLAFENLKSIKIFKKTMPEDVALEL